jgi:hypothetical protein
LPQSFAGTFKLTISFYFLLRLGVFFGVFPLLELFQMAFPEVDEYFVLLHLFLIELADQTLLLGGLLLLDQVLLAELQQQGLLLSEFLLILLLLLPLIELFHQVFHHVLVHLVHHVVHRSATTAPAALPPAPALLLVTAPTHHLRKHLLHLSQVVELNNHNPTDRKSSRNYSNSPKSPMNSWNSANSAN